MSSISLSAFYLSILLSIYLHMIVIITIIIGFKLSNNFFLEIFYSLNRFIAINECCGGLLSEFLRMMYFFISKHSSGYVRNFFFFHLWRKNNKKNNSNNHEKYTHANQPVQKKIFFSHVSRWWWWWMNLLRAKTWSGRWMKEQEEINNY